MATANTTIDKFGRRRRGTSKSIIQRGPPGVGFELTSDGHFDIQNKRLKRMGDPRDSQDGATRNYVETRIANYHLEVRKGLSDVNDLIIATMKRLISTQSVKSKEEFNTALNQRNIDLMEQMQSSIDKKLSTLSTDVVEQMRVYISKQLAGVNSSNTLLMRQHNMLIERIDKLYQIVEHFHPKQKGVPSFTILEHPKQKDIPSREIFEVLERERARQKAGNKISGQSIPKGREKPTLDKGVATITEESLRTVKK